MPYPDNFNGTPYDADRCTKCGHRDYTNDHGVCGECEWREKIALKEIKDENIRKMENASHAAYLHVMMHIGNVKAARALGWI